MTTKSFQAVRGVRDILPGETAAWSHLEQTARRVFQGYGYQEVRTPLFERTELFARAVGETTDIVEKEMYTFLDRGGDSLTLRPEGTASVVRAFIENRLDRQLPWGVFYLGPMFRYERPQKGRYRQFHQIGVELFGPAGPLADAEMMVMALRFFRAVGLERTLTLEVNSLGCPTCRPPYREALLAFLRQASGELCHLCQQRMERNPLRVLDCKNEACRAVALRAPHLRDGLCPDCDSHFQGVLGHLTRLQAPHRVNPLMVRGLDYYTRTAFEVTTTALGAQNAVAAGGRYDNLTSEMGGVATPAIGFAMGLERLVLLLDQTRVPTDHPHLFVAALGTGSEAAALALGERLRDAGWRVQLNLSGGSFQSQLKKADRSRATLTLIVGEQEIANGEVQIKAMATGQQERVALAALESWLTRALQDDLR